MIKIEIKNRYTGSLIFEYSKENNTIKETLLEAVKNKINLCDAELCRAKFYGKGGTKKLTKKQLPDFLNALGFQVVD